VSGSTLPGPPSLSDPAAFIREQTTLVSPPLVPELRLWTATEITPLWEATELLMQRTGIEPPFWAYAWPGSQALARFLLDQPELVAGKRVLDVGSGNGLAALAAARAGAQVVANDVDPMSLVAVALNAEENGLSAQGLLADLTGGEVLVDADVVLVGDLCYDKNITERLLSWLRGRVAAGARVLIAEPGRAFAPREGVRALATYTVPTTMELESRTERETVILELLG
jgi:predicted nicotinamide N-methyase